MDKEIVAKDSSGRDIFFEAGLPETNLKKDLMRCPHCKNVLSNYNEVRRHLRDGVSFSFYQTQKCLTTIPTVSAALMSKCTLMISEGISALHPTLS